MARQYTVIEQLQTDDVGTVELAFAKEAPQEKVLLKRLHPHLAAEPRTVERFLARAKQVKRAQGPGVFRVLDVGVDQAGAFFCSANPSGKSFIVVMEWLVNHKPKIALDVACSIVAEAARALQSALDRLEDPEAFGAFGLSAERVWIRQNGEVMLLFGGVIPEADQEATDIFSMGVLLWEVIQKDESGAAGPSMPEELPTLETDGGTLAQLVGRAMAWGERFESPLEMGQALESYLKMKGTLMRTPERARALKDFFRKHEPRTDRIPAGALLAGKSKTSMSELPSGLNRLPQDPPPDDEFQETLIAGSERANEIKEALQQVNRERGLVAQKGPKSAPKVPERPKPPKTPKQKRSIDADPTRLPAPADSQDDQDTRLLIPQAVVERIHGRDVKTGAGLRAQNPASLGGLPIMEDFSAANSTVKVPTRSSKRYWVLGAVLLVVAGVVVIMATVLTP